MAHVIPAAERADRPRGRAAVVGRGGVRARAGPPDHELRVEPVVHPDAAPVEAPVPALPGGAAGELPVEMDISPGIDPLVAVASIGALDADDALAGREAAALTVRFRDVVERGAGGA